MDNASKAIIIAGGILVGTLIISLAMYMLTQYRDFYSGSMDILNTNRVNSFNIALTKYGPQDTAVQIYGYDVWGIMSYVKQAREDDSSLGNTIVCEGDISLDNYTQKLFFTDALTRVYSYTYELGSNGVVSKVTINSII